GGGNDAGRAARCPLMRSTRYGTISSIAGMSGTASPSGGDAQVGPVSSVRSLRRPRAAARVTASRRPGSWTPCEAAPSEAAPSGRPDRTRTERSASVALSVGTSAYPWSERPQPPSARWLPRRKEIRRSWPLSQGASATTRPVSYTDGDTCPQGRVTRLFTSSAALAAVSLVEVVLGLADLAVDDPWVVATRECSPSVRVWRASVRGESFQGESVRTESILRYARLMSFTGHP